MGKTADCLEVIEQARVSFDWSFPWIPRRDDKQERKRPSNDCFEAESDLGARKEYWRMYKSEHFILYRALVDDWYKQDPYKAELADKHPPRKFVSYFASIVYLITQCILFAQNLARKGLYKEGLKITMTLHHIHERELYLDASGRTPFEEPRITGASKIKLEEQLSSEALIQDALVIANKFILCTLDHFNFHPSAATISDEQQKLMRDG